MWELLAVLVVLDMKECKACCFRFCNCFYSSESQLEQIVVYVALACDKRLSFSVGLIFPIEFSLVNSSHFLIFPIEFSLEFWPVTSFCLSHSRRSANVVL